MSDSMADDERKQTVLELLKENREKFNIEYHGYLTNHIAHALIALYRLNATSARIREFFGHYIQKLEPRIPPTSVVNKDNWSSFKGQRQNYSGLVQFFESEIKQKGVDPVLNEYVPHLIEGASGSAFHGLIELGYSLELLEDLSLIAEGLAYWTYSFASLGEPNQQATMKDPFEILKAVYADKTFDDVHTKQGFQKTMKSLLQPKYQAVLPKYDLAIDTNADPDQLAQTFMLTAVDLFLYTGAIDFFLLHGVTSMRALKVVISHINDKKVKASALRYFWRAVVCAYISQGRLPIREVAEFQSRNVEWSEIITKGITYNEEHLIKLIFVCHEEVKNATGDIEMMMYKEAALEGLTHYIQQHDWTY